MARVDLKSARTSEADPARAAEDLMNQLGSVTPKLVTLFASSERDQGALNRAVRARLPSHTRLIGATSGGEIDNDGIHHGTVVLSALTGDFDVALGLGTGLTADAIAAGARATAAACAEFGVRAQDLDPRQHVGLVIDDGFRFKKEEMLLGLLDRNPALTLVGGGASNREADFSKLSALLHVDGENYVRIGTSRPAVRCESRAPTKRAPARWRSTNVPPRNITRTFSASPSMISSSANRTASPKNQPR
jgi:hypothetical protein